MTATLPASLRPDCARCVALCCVAPAFDAEQGFGYDKPACEPCRHLHADNRCGIHPALVAQGFSGCASFNCFGAGQRATALFDGCDWRASPGQATRMFERYARLRAPCMNCWPWRRWPNRMRRTQQPRRMCGRCSRTWRDCAKPIEPVDGVALRRQTSDRFSRHCAEQRSNEWIADGYGAAVAVAAGILVWLFRRTASPG